jgi:hypothetical protein
LRSNLAAVNQKSATTATAHSEEEFGLLERLPAECVDFIYLDAPFFSAPTDDGAAGVWAGAQRTAERWGTGLGAYLAQIAAPLESMHRILKPSGALFLVCGESDGLYARLLLEEIDHRPLSSDRMVWWKADSRPAHHCVLYYRKSTTAERHGHLYTVIRHRDKESRSLVGFSLVHRGAPRRVANRAAA